MIRQDHVKEAIKQTCGVFEKQELTYEEIEHVALCLYEAAKRQQAEKISIKEKALKYIPAAISTLAIIISAISIIASILK